MLDAQVTQIMVATLGKHGNSLAEFSHAVTQVRIHGWRGYVG